jgi:shikimate kinase
VPPCHHYQPAVKIGIAKSMTLKLKRTPGLYLVGFMASGKTTIGRSLADELGWCFFDIDQEIEEQEGRPITQIFKDQGETVFREIESAVLCRRVSYIEAGNPCVVALGGGAFIQPRNWDIIENNGVTVWLDCSLERIESRLGTDAVRPLAADREQMKQLYEARKPLYARADFHIDADCENPEEVLHKILNLPIF